MRDAASRSLPWLMLLSRTGLFLGFQACIAALLWLAGAAAAWDASAAWWTITAALTNVVSVVLLVGLFRAEGRRYWELFRFERATVGRDLAVVLGLGVLTAIAAVVPSQLVATWLFGDPAATLPMMFRPLPLWAIVPAFVLFPLTIPLAEIPTYFGYVMPRLEPQIGKRWAVIVAATALAAQHVTLPLLLDIRFMLWRLLMFLPLALLLAVALRWRPRLLPYLAIVHGLLDFSAAWMVLSASL